jgi:coenzyme F420-0:L-glutamate ligase / coenzyme F420-1:gamma-L-glutamate ligase
VVRGLSELITDADSSARELIRTPAKDMFSFGSLESVLAAALVATGQPNRYEELVALDRAEQTSRLLAGRKLGTEAEALLRAIMAVDLTNTQELEIDSPLLETDR